MGALPPTRSPDNEAHESDDDHDDDVTTAAAKEVVAVAAGGRDGKEMAVATVVPRAPSR